MLTLSFLVAYAVLAFCPETPLARTLRRTMIDLPVQILAKLTRRKLILLLLVGLAAAVAVALVRLDRDLIVFAQGLPEGVAWVATFDIATYLDVIAVAWILAASVRLRAVHRALRTWAVRLTKPSMLRRRDGNRRVTVTRKERQPVARPRSDDEQSWSAFGFA